MKLRNYRIRHKAVILWSRSHGLFKSWFIIWVNNKLLSVALDISNPVKQIAAENTENEKGEEQQTGGIEQTGQRKYNCLQQSLDSFYVFGDFEETGDSQQLNNFNELLDGLVSLKEVHYDVDYGSANDEEVKSN